MADAFARLPLEILVLIIRDVSNLPSLYRFVCASSRVNEAFTLDAAHTLDKIIKRSIPDFEPLARMISIIGSLEKNTHPLNFDSLVAKYKSLPKDVLTTAAPSFAFSGTLGPRYVLLTAYRIEYLRHICFVTLLQNIHERVFVSKVDKVRVSKTPPEKLPELKSFRHGVYFKATAWWSPSRVERFRIERALWKLFVCWGIQVIDNDIAEDLHFSRYDEKVQRINPILEVKPSLYIYDNFERSEMACVSDALCEFLNCKPFVLFMQLPAQKRKLYVQEPWSKFEANFREVEHWRFKEPKLWESQFDKIWVRGASKVCEPNSRIDNILWWVWYMYKKTELEIGDIYFTDYLGLCLWDQKRLEFLRLRRPCRSIVDWGLGPSKEPDEKFSFSRIERLWFVLFLDEMNKLPRGGERELSSTAKQHLQFWKDKLISMARYFNFESEIDGVCDFNEGR